MLCWVSIPLETACPFRPESPDPWWLLIWCCQAPGPWRCRCLCSSLQVVTAFTLTLAAPPETVTPYRISSTLDPNPWVPGSRIPKGRADLVRGLGRRP